MRIHTYMCIYTHTHIFLCIHLFLYIFFYTHPSGAICIILLWQASPRERALGFICLWVGFPLVLACPVLGLGFPWKAEPPARLPGFSSPLSNLGAIPCAAIWC